MPTSSTCALTCRHPFYYRAPYTTAAALTRTYHCTFPQRAADFA